MWFFKSKKEKEIKKEFKADLGNTKFNDKTIKELSNGKGEDE